MVGEIGGDGGISVTRNRIYVSERAYVPHNGVTWPSHLGRRKRRTPSTWPWEPVLCFQARSRWAARWHEGQMPRIAFLPGSDVSISGGGGMLPEVATASTDVEGRPVMAAP